MEGIFGNFYLAKHCYVVVEPSLRLIWTTYGSSSLDMRCKVVDYLEPVKGRLEKMSKAALEPLQSPHFIYATCVFLSYFSLTGSFSLSSFLHSPLLTHGLDLLDMGVFVMMSNGHRCWIFHQKEYIHICVIAC
jgi:uncharacterized membrane protein YcfT